MKISLTDVASFATGVLDANQKNTENRIKLREKQLQADRDFNIAQKQDKYAAELALYKKEKEKAAEITRLNEEVKNNKLGQEAYATQYLMTTLGADKYKILQSQPDVLTGMLNDIKETKDYKFSLNRDLIDKQAQVDTATINKVFAEEMKNPKGEDVLVNKIRGLLGMKQDATETVQDNLNKQLEAAKIVEKVVDQRSELSGIKLPPSTKGQAKPPEKYETTFTTLQKEAKFNSINSKDNLLNFINASKNLGFTKEINFTFDDKDKTITGVNESSQAFLNSYKLIYDTILKQNNAKQLYNNVTKNASDLVNIIDSNDIHRKTQNIILERQSKEATGNWSSEKNRELITLVPINVVDSNSQVTKGSKTVTVDLDRASKIYTDFLKEKGNILYKDSEDFIKLSNVQQLIENGNAKLINELKDRLITGKSVEGIQDKQTSSTPKIKEESKVTPKSNLRLIPDGTGFAEGSKKYTWKTIEDTNQVNKLTPELKDAYNKWKATQTKSNPTKADLFKQSLGG
jgi:hypothetical protein